MTYFTEVHESKFGTVERDAWFTPRETSKKIVDYLLEKYPEWKDLEWVEPSAGDGSFIDACENRGIMVTGYDLEPKREDISKMNFLDAGTLFTDHIDLTGKIVIGNPPYGKYNKLSIEFINKSFELGAEKVAFLLLSSMLNISYLKKIDGSVELVKDIDTKFYVDSVASDLGVPTLLFVFDKKCENFPLGISTDPYCKAVTYREKVFNSDIVFSYKYIDTFANFDSEIESYSRVSNNAYKSPGKNNIYYIIRFYDNNDFDSNKDVLEIIVKYSAFFHRRPSTSTLNYWLLPENRAKLDFEAL